MRHRRSFRSVPRRRVVWADKRVDNRTPVSGTALPDDLLDSFRTAGGNTQNVTVRRIILHIGFGETSNAAGSINDTADFGLVIADTGASGARVPIPTTDPNADWMWVQHRHPT